MTNWTPFYNEQENGVLVTVELLQQIIDNTQNIYERVVTIETLAGGITPIGAIMLWKGSAASIPQGFQVADGTNGTPDLRGNFLMGIASTETDDNLLETGGALTHTHTLGAVTKATKHTHGIYLNNSSHWINAASGVMSAAWMSHNHGWSAVTSSNDEHSNVGTYSETDHLPTYTKYYWIARIPA